MRLSLLVLALAALLAAPAAADPARAAALELELKLRDHVKGELKDLSDEIKAQIDQNHKRTDERVDEINQRVAQIGQNQQADYAKISNWVTWLSVFIGVLTLAVTGAVVWFAVRSRQDAQQAIKEWIQQHAKESLQQNFEQLANEAKNRMYDIEIKIRTLKYNLKEFEPVRKQIKQEMDSINNSRASHQEQFSHFRMWLETIQDESHRDLTPTDHQNLTLAASKVLGRPPALRNTWDWRVLALHAAYHGNQDLKKVTYYINRAVDCAKTPLEHLRALTEAQELLWRRRSSPNGAAATHAEAMAEADAVAERLAADPGPEGEEAAAKARSRLEYVRGLWATNQRPLPDDRAYKAFKKAADITAGFQSVAAQVQTANALNNAGLALLALVTPDLETAIKEFESVVKKFEKSAHPLLRVQAATALFNKGTALGLLNPSEQTIKDHLAVIERLAARPDNTDDVRGLLDEAEAQARALLSQAP